MQSEIIEFKILCFSIFYFIYCVLGSKISKSFNEKVMLS
jgi:hypothetical protein